MYHKQLKMMQIAYSLVLLLNIYTSRMPYTSYLLSLRLSYLKCVLQMSQNTMLITISIY